MICPHRVIGYLSVVFLKAKSSFTYSAFCLLHMKSQSHRLDIQMDADSVSAK